MNKLIFEVTTPTLPIVGASERFAVRRIYCVGQNYAAHTREMGGDPERTPPFYFSKPPDAIVQNGVTIPFPPRTEDLHHEIELVVAIGGTGSKLSVDEASKIIFGYAVGIDLTRRDLQAQAKKAGRPWDTAKGFDNSAPISSNRRVSEIGQLAKGHIWLTVNGESRQDADLCDMIWNVPEALAELSTYFALHPGDLLFTGTPSGVGPVARGDKLRGGITGVGEISVSIAS
jgi:fumarylpyruvate hydrolase